MRHGGPVEDGDEATAGAVPVVVVRVIGTPGAVVYVTCLGVINLEL